MTLIEIIAGLVVLGVLVSSVLVARGRFLRQWSSAQRTAEVCAAVDRMLAQWLPASAGGTDAIPVPNQGAVEGAHGCTWRTQWMSDAAARKVGAGVVRLTVSEKGKTLLALELLKQQPLSPATRQTVPR